VFINELSTLNLFFSRHNIGEKSLNQQLTVRNRKGLEADMARTLSDEIKGLSVEMQKILVDDMVTAFENRLLIFTQNGRSRR